MKLPLLILTAAMLSLFLALLACQNTAPPDLQSEAEIPDALCALGPPPFTPPDSGAYRMKKRWQEHCAGKEPLSQAEYTCIATLNRFGWQLNSPENITQYENDCQSFRAKKTPTTLPLPTNTPQPLPLPYQAPTPKEPAISAPDCPPPDGWQWPKPAMRDPAITPMPLWPCPNQNPETATPR